MAWHSMDGMDGMDGSMDDSMDGGGMGMMAWY